MAGPVLPDELMVLVLLKLPDETLIGVVAMVCRRWRRLAGSPEVLEKFGRAIEFAKYSV